MEQRIHIIEGYKVEIMTRTYVSKMTNEDIILALCRGYYQETKKARKEEQYLISELDKRGIIDKEKMSKNILV